MIKRTKCKAAINGGFFCMKTFKPIGDVRSGSVCSYGSYGYDLVINGRNVKFLKREEARKQIGQLLGLGPRLAWNNQSAVFPASEGYTSSVHFTRQIRTAIGLRNNNKLILVVSRRPMFLGELSKDLISYGCKYGFSLDGGSSTGLYYNGKYIAGPGRNVCNFVVSYD